MKEKILIVEDDEKIAKLIEMEICLFCFDQYDELI